jgi:hypothetical protein
LENLKGLFKILETLQNFPKKKVPAKKITQDHRAEGSKHNNFMRETTFLTCAFHMERRRPSKSPQKACMNKTRAVTLVLLKCNFFNQFFLIPLPSLEPRGLAKFFCNEKKNEQNANLRSSMCHLS